MNSRTVTEESVAPAGVSRRTLVGAAAWGVPAVSLATAVPAWAAASDVTQVSLSVPSNQLPASGATPVVATVRDHLGSPLAGRAVSLTGPAGAVFAPATGTTNGSGQFSTTVNLSTPWATPGKTVTLTAVSGGTAASASALVLGSNLVAWGTQTPLVFPSPVVDYTQVSAVSGLAVLADGSVWQSTPDWTVMPGITGAARVSVSQAGTPSVYVLKKDGTVVGWGGNGDGQLGDGTTTDRSSPVVFQGLSDIVQIQAGPYGLHAIKSDGSLWYQGNNEQGRGGVNEYVSPVPLMQVGGLPGSVVQVVNWVGDTAAAVLDDTTVWTWGRNDEGQLANGTRWDYEVLPLQVPGLEGTIALAGSTTFADEGGANYLAVKYDGTVWSWGRNESGQLGRDGTTNSFEPAQVPGLSGVTQIATTPSGSYALTADGTFLNWGLVEGPGGFVVRPTPTVVPVPHPIAKLLGSHGHSYNTTDSPFLTRLG